MASPAKMHKLNCIQCGKEFFLTESEKKRKKGSFCSSKCYHDFLASQKTPNTVCANCSKPLYKKPSLLKRQSNSFCDRDCKASFEAKAKNAELQKRKKARIAEIKKVRGDKCQACGWPHHLDVPCDGHHIIPHHKGGDESDENIIILCPCCHRLAHTGHLSPEKLREINQK